MPIPTPHSKNRQEEGPNIDFKRNLKKKTIKKTNKEEYTSLRSHT
jgi:hypothetical protein